jgi:Glycosyl transferase family 2
MSNHESGAVKYSVIIPAYNVGAFIEETIRNVLRRESNDYEIIVVDDGSSDNTCQVLKSIVSAKVSIIFQRNMGVSEARNVGLKHARGMYLLFLDGDDLLESSLFDQVALPMELDPKVVVVYGNYRRITENGRPIYGYFGGLRRRPSGSVLRRLLRGNFIASPGMAMVRATTARKVGGFDPSLNMSEDWNFWCRVAAHGLFINLPKLCLLEYRQRHLSSTRTLGFQLQNHHRASESTFSTPEIVAMLDSSEHARLRRQHDGHVHCFLSCQRIRAGQLSAAGEELMSAILINPGRCLEFASRTFLAWVFTR